MTPFERGGIITTLLLFFSAGAMADITLRYDEVQGDRHRPLQQAQLARGFLRIDPLDSPKLSLLIDLKQGDLYQLRHDQRRFFRIALRSLLQYSGLYENNRSVFQGLVDQGLRQLDPGQRAQAERFLRQLSKPRRARIEIRPLPRKGRVLGIDCRYLAVLQPGSAPREICVTPFRRLGLGADDLRNIQQLQSLARGLQQAGLSRWFGSLLRGWQDLGGLPMEVLARGSDGRVLEHWRLGRLSRSPIRSGTLQRPAGYEESTTPLL
jgi:hypothetical protein